VQILCLAANLLHLPDEPAGVALTTVAAKCTAMLAAARSSSNRSARPHNAAPSRHAAGPGLNPLGLPAAQAHRVRQCSGADANFACFAGQFNAPGRKQPFLSDPDDLPTAFCVISRANPRPRDVKGTGPIIRDVGTVREVGSSIPIPVSPRSFRSTIRVQTVDRGRSI